ncbi:MAG: polymer-forming cytoskeletal protein [Candidatus Avelusimicrobium sp.]|uniref:bactofilin family protein n=1 Tax=Candidatus Avelusimicrobium sp. TaxID=3048833 RepID=UPI003EFF3F7E
MGFLKKDSDFSSGEHYSVVSAECYFQGALSVQGSLRVDGTLEGTVDNARHVIVGTEGKIVGDVTAQVVVCGGVIEGNVCADMLEVLAPASIKGDIRAKKMMVEEGGRIDGRCAIGGTEGEEISSDDDAEEDDKSKK